MVEQMNRTLKAMFRKHTAQFGKQWDQFLPGVLGMYGNTPHDTTLEKPSLLLFGVDLRSPTEVALLPPHDLERADLSDFREEFVLSLSLAREHAVSSFPQDKSRKQRKLSRRGVVLIVSPQSTDLMQHY